MRKNEGRGDHESQSTHTQYSSALLYGMLQSTYLLLGRHCLLHCHLKIVQTPWNQRWTYWRYVLEWRIEKMKILKRITYAEVGGAACKRLQPRPRVPKSLPSKTVGG